MCSTFLHKSFQTDDDKMERVQAFFLMQVNKRKYPENVPKWQIGCPEVIPKLRAMPFWLSSHLSWLEVIAVHGNQERGSVFNHCAGCEISVPAGEARVAGSPRPGGVPRVSSPILGFKECHQGQRWTRNPWHG
jgi:hypothetical protein